MSILLSLLILVSPAQALASTDGDSVLTREVSGAAVQDGAVDLGPMTRLSTDPMALQVGPNLSVEHQLGSAQALSLTADAISSWDLSHQAMGLGLRYSQPEDAYTLDVGVRMSDRGGTSLHLDYERATAQSAWQVSGSLSSLDRTPVAVGSVSWTHRW